MTQQPYFPNAGEAWHQVAPERAGFSSDRLAATISFARDNETPWPKSFYYDDGRYAPNVDWNESGPWSAVVGPVRPRGAAAGMILKGGRIVAQW
ncbi:MAG: serine hydrolase, partial [Tardiphaga sp.]